LSIPRPGLKRNGHKKAHKAYKIKFSFVPFVPFCG